MSFWASKLIDYVRLAIKTVVEALENINMEVLEVRQLMIVSPNFFSNEGKS
jgi:hypothetical protein